MTYHADLSRMSDTRLTLIAVGWLEPEQPYAKGHVNERFFARLMEILVAPWEPFAAGGRHACGFCRFTGARGPVRYSRRPGEDLSVAIGAANVFVPGRECLYMAPSMIVHYIDAHEYKPPDAFIDAVLACPEMKSAAYLQAIHAVGGAKLLKPPPGVANADRANASVVVSRACPSCNGPETVRYVQAIAGERLRYSESVRCEKCGRAVESDGDVVPDEVRVLFYAGFGRWGLEVVDAGSRRVEAARALAEALGLESAEALRMLQPNVTLKEGTHVEIEWLERRLHPFGVVVRVARLDP